MVKIKSINILILIAIFLGFQNSAWPKSWHFLEWTSNIFVNDDSTFIVRETQTAEFIGSYSSLRQVIQFNKAKKITDVKVFDEKDRELTSKEADIRYESDKVRICIYFQAQDEKKTWTVEYKVYGGISFSHNKDELQWSIVSTSPDRQASIDKLSVFVYLPRQSPINKLKPSLDINCVQSKDELENCGVLCENIIKYWGANIAPSENFIITAQFPRGLLKIDQWDIVSQYLWLLIPIFTFVFLYWRWWEKKYYFYKNRIILTEYDPLYDLTPMESSFLLRKRIRIRDISATLIDLACRGYIKIIEQEKISIPKSYIVYRFQKQKDFTKSPELKKHEIIILKSIFGTEDRVDLSQLKDNFNRNFLLIKEKILDELINNGYITSDPKSKRKKVIIASLIVSSCGLIFFLASILATLSFILTGLLISAFGLRISVETQKGIEAKKHILGFKEYLSVKERFTLKSNIIPEKFEQYLPYSIALDLDKNWVNRFTRIRRRSPDWYIPIHEWDNDLLFIFISNFEFVIGSLPESLSQEYSSDSYSSSSNLSKKAIEQLKGIKKYAIFNEQNHNNLKES